jgi:hypothetical protein
MSTYPKPDATCLRCQGVNLHLGKIISRGEGCGVGFRPENMRFWSGVFSGGVEFENIARACLDCGFIWTEASPRELRKFVAAKCKSALKQR